MVLHSLAGKQFENMLQSLRSPISFNLETFKIIIDLRVQLSGLKFWFHRVLNAMLCFIHQTNKSKDFDK